VFVPLDPAKCTPQFHRNRMVAHVAASLLPSSYC